MLHIPITKLGRHVPYLQPLFPSLLLTAHTKSCPTKKKVAKCPTKAQPKPPQQASKGPVCPGGGDSGSTRTVLKRALTSGKVRLAIFPDEWFLFFHSKTGVTGPYIFGIMFTNYIVSKEIYVMEHEYYTGLSLFIMTCYFTMNFGPTVTVALDKEVDEVADSFEKVRRDEIAIYDDIIKQGKDAQWRAEGQKLLMDAKKENVTMQLEAIYRERLMKVYNTVKGRMDYQVKVYRAQARIQQKWMLEWILSNVMKSITPELEKEAMERAIQDLATVAAERAKKAK